MFIRVAIGSLVRMSLAVITFCAMCALVGCSGSRADERVPQTTTPTWVSYSLHKTHDWPVPEDSTWSISTDGKLTGGCGGQATAEELAEFITVATSPAIVAAFAKPDSCQVSDGDLRVSVVYVDRQAYEHSLYCENSFEPVVEAANKLFSAACARKAQQTADGAAPDSGVDAGAADGATADGGAADGAPICEPSLHLLAYTEAGCGADVPARQCIGNNTCIMWACSCAGKVITGCNGFPEPWSYKIGYDGPKAPTAGADCDPTASP